MGVPDLRAAHSSLIQTANTFSAHETDRLVFLQTHLSMLTLKTGLFFFFIRCLKNFRKSLEFQMLKSCFCSIFQPGDFLKSNAFELSAKCLLALA